MLYDGMFIMNECKKGQSAMEYLITYSWALIIIGIVVAALFALKVLQPGTQTQCFLQAGFSCENLILAQNGMLIVNLLQTTQTPINVTAIECNSNTTQLGSEEFVTNPLFPGSGNAMPVSGNHTFIGIQCYLGGQPFTSAAGATYQGDLIINYTEQFTGFKHVVIGKLVVSAS
jgi:hypothetical protein